jgi:hypothetical protein
MITSVTKPVGAGNWSLKKTGRVARAVLMLVSLLDLQSGMAQAQNTPPASNPSGISLVIHAPTNVVKVGDEIPIEFIISNRGTEDYSDSDTAWESGSYAHCKLVARTTSGAIVPAPLEYTDPEEYVFVNTSLDRLAFTPPALRVAAPGKSFSETRLLNSWALITEPGRYEIAGTYSPHPKTYSREDREAVAAASISITVLPRTKEEMHDYIQGLTNQVAERLAAHVKHLWLHDPVLQLSLEKLMYTCSPDIVPTLIRTMYEDCAESKFAEEALFAYVPHTKETREAIMQAAIKQGVNGYMELLMLVYDFTGAELKPIIERGLALEDPVERYAGVALAARCYDDAFTAQLIAIANGSIKTAENTRSAAIGLLGIHRTDAGVKALKTLLNDPDPAIYTPLALAILNGYMTNAQSATRRHLEPEDFSAEDMRPLIERLLAWENGSFWGLTLAEEFGDDALAPTLIALATNPASPNRLMAFTALALNRTDEGVKTLKALLNDPDLSIAKLVEDSIRIAYTNRLDARGRPLRPDDFDAKYQQPEVKPGK